MLDPVVLPKVTILMTLATLISLIFVRNRKTILLDSDRFLTSIFLLFLLGFFISVILNFEDSEFQTYLFGVWKRNNGILTQVATLVIFFMFCLKSEKGDLNKSLRTISTLGLVLSVYGVFQVHGLDFIQWQDEVKNSPTLTLGNTNFSMNFLTLAVLANLRIVFSLNLSVWIRATFTLSSLMAIYLIAVTQTVQSWTSLFLATLCLLTIRCFARAKRAYRVLGWSVIFVMASVITIFILSIFNRGPLTSIAGDYFFSLKDRFYIWETAIAMIKKNPIKGVGIDSFGENYRLYRSTQATQFQGGGNVGTDDAHNFFLQSAATGGVLLGLLYIFLFAFVSYLCISHLRKFRDDIEVSVGFVLWICFLIQNLVTISEPGVAIWGWITGGCLVGYVRNKGRLLVHDQNRLGRSEQREISKPSGRFTSLLIPLCLTGFFLVGLLSYLNQSIQEIQLKNLLVKSALVSTPAQRELNVKEIVRLANDLPYAASRMVVLDGLVKLNRVDDALSVGKEIVRDFPKSILGWDAVATIYEATGRKDLAYPYRQMTVNLDPKNEELRQLLISES